MGAGAHGGLYKRYTLFDYLPKFNGEYAWIPGLDPFTEPGSWHGAPMAALWRVQHSGQSASDASEPAEERFEGAAGLVLETDYG